MLSEVEGQPSIIKVTHWFGAAMLVGLALSGLQIDVAYPHLGPRGQTYWWWPQHGWIAPENLRIGGWLGGARAWHFALMWPLCVCGLVYFVYLSRSGRWRRLVFISRDDVVDAVSTLKTYVSFKTPPHAPHGYNGLQKAAYSTALFMIIVEVLSGLAMWKPVQLWWIAMLFGGYEGARAVHLILLLLLTSFVVAHVLMVSIHPKSLLAMTVALNKSRPISTKNTQPITEQNHAE